MNNLRAAGLTCLLGLIVLFAAKAQPRGAAEPVPLATGQTFTIPSRVLGETRRINMYVPPAYRDSATLRLPVLYMPDGGMKDDFLHVAGLVQVLVGNGTMRPFILVGTWHYETMPQETHQTIYHPAAFKAFRLVFKPTAKPAGQ